MAKRPRRAPAPADPSAKIIDAALERVPIDGWTKLTMRQIAQAAGLSLADVGRIFPSKTAILAGFLRRIDGAVAA
ncbi:MAG: TetR family transcriptional regulator, partial [Proteobacteria bacterium]|nr:TetR family transcriptional regulator [Pseudomonadota bacterium]